MAVYEALLLNTVVPQIQAAQAGDSYVMVVNATTPALRITQTGTGDAILVEDAANPDSSPFVVTAGGDVGIGTSSPGVKLDVVGQGRVLYNTGATNTGDQSVVTVGATTSGAYASSYGAGLQFQITNSGGGFAGSRIVSRLGADNNTANLVFQARNYGFSDSMTLDASGNLVVGDTTAGARLHVSKTGAGTIEVAWINNAQAVGANVGSRLVFTGTTNNNGLAAVSGAFEGATTADGGYMTFATRAVTSGTLTERARITSGGDLLVGPTSVPSPVANYRSLVVGGSTGGIVDIGTTSTSYGRVSADSVGLNVESLGATTTIFRTDSTERARITSGGGFVTKPSAGNESVFNEDGVDADFRVESDTNTHMLFVDAGANAVLINQTSNTNGGALSVNGTFSVCDSATGLQSSMSKIGTKQTASISTSATTIFTDVTQGMSSASAGQLLIFGDDNSGNGFMDVVAARSSGTVAVVSSSTLRGSPAARTYTMSTAALQLAMASGTYSTMVRCETLGFPF